MLKRHGHHKLPPIFFTNHNLLRKSERTEKPHETILNFDEMRACQIYLF